jgi:hypothetical protein
MKVIIDSQQLEQKGEDITIILQDVIDNRMDDYVIFPREISYYVGYFNISNDLHNNKFMYSNHESRTHIIQLADGLYTLKKYFNEIKTHIANNGDNPSHINYTYYDFNGTIKISVTPPHTFSILQHQTQLLGFNNPQVIANHALSSNPVNFIPHKMLYIHLKQLKNSNIYINNSKSDILAIVPVTTGEFGTLVNYKFGLPHANELVNTTINCLELTITDENNNIIDFHGMPVFYTLEICKK